MLEVTSPGIDRVLGARLSTSSAPWVAGWQAGDPREMPVDGRSRFKGRAAWRSTATPHMRRLARRVRDPVCRADRVAQRAFHPVRRPRRQEVRQEEVGMELTSTESSIRSARTRASAARSSSRRSRRRWCRAAAASYGLPSARSRPSSTSAPARSSCSSSRPWSMATRRDDAEISVSKTPASTIPRPRSTTRSV